MKWNQDELIVDGRTMKSRQDVNTDINKDTTEAATKVKARHTTITTKDNNSFQGHSVHIESVDDVIPAVKALGSDIRISGATHVMYAYRVGNQKHSCHNWDDDGQWGGGRTIMQSIQSKQLYNTLICVTHWSGGRNLGGERFDCIKGAAETAISAATGGL